MFLTVPLGEGTFVVDPGFGSFAPDVPLLLADGTAARTASATHWMARDGDLWVLRAQTAEETLDCWVSALDEDNLIDFEVGNHFTATHPTSPFVNRIMMRALTREGRVTLMNRDLTVWRGDQADATQLASRAALRGLLVEHFGFDLPEVDCLRVPSIPEWA